MSTHDEEHDRQVSANHWMSYQVSRMQCSSSTPRSMITVILDAGTYRQFSGIRVVVVCNEETYTTTARTIMPVSTLYDLTSVPQPSHRDHLNRHRHLVDHGHGYPIDGVELPLCAIVFEVYLTRVLHSAFRLRLTSNKTHGRLRILHDLEYPCSADRTSLSLVFVNHPAFTSATQRRAHTVRILPLPARRDPGISVSDLPETCLRNMLQFAIGENDAIPQETLNNYRKVCRTWASVVSKLVNDETV